ncbi:MAG: glycosyltransferase family 39 protein [Acidobacteria bacterium]|nr:glycosyltransferase family 39 protein [Acidobacteriota bacterium]
MSEKLSTNRTIPLLLLLAFAVLLLRLPYTSVQFWTIDEAGFAAVANKLSDGHSLYREACDNKPPFVFHFYAAVFSLFGRGNMTAVHLATLLFVFLGLWFFYRLSREIFRGKIAAISLIAYAFYLVASSPADTFASNTEIYMMPMVIAGVYFCLAGLRIITGWHWVAAGFFFGMAAWIKQTGILFCLAVPVAALVDAYPLERSSVIRAIRRCVLGFLGFCAISLFWMVLMWKEGIFHEFLDMVILYNTKVQVASIPAWLSIQMASYTILAHFKSHFGAIIIAFVGFGLLVHTVIDGWKAGVKQPVTNVSVRSAIILFSWLAISIAAVSIGGRFYGYYMYVLAPILAALIAVAFDYFYRRQPIHSSLTRYALTILLIIGCALPLLSIHRNYLGQAKTAIIKIENKYDPSLSGWIGIPTLTVSKYVEENTDPNDQIFVWGYQPCIYVLSGRNFASRYFSVALQTGFVWGTLQQMSGWASEFNINHPAMKAGTFKPSDSAQWIYPGSQELLLKELRTNPPELFIDGNVAGEWPFGDKFPIAAFPVFETFLTGHYRLEKTVTGYRVYRSLKSQRQAPELVAALLKVP